MKAALSTRLLSIIYSTLFKFCKFFYNQRIHVALSHRKNRRFLSFTGILALSRRWKGSRTRLFEASSRLAAPLVVKTFCSTREDFSRRQPFFSRRAPLLSSRMSL